MTALHDVTDDQPTDTGAITAHRTDHGLRAWWHRKLGHQLTIIEGVPELTWDARAAFTDSVEDLFMCSCTRSWRRNQRLTPQHD